MRCICLCLVVCVGLLAASVEARPQRQSDRNNFFPQQQQQQQQQGPFGQGNRRPGFNFENRPPFPNGSQRPPNNGGVGSSTAAPAPAVTTASPQYLACLQSCPSTSEYNPVCGDDSINYHNNARLDCARRCGKNVAAVRSGTCNAL